MYAGVLGSGIAAVLPVFFGDRWPHETGFYAAIACKAAREGKWLPLEVSDGLYFNKPPLGFWAYAASIKLFGTETWAIHLPTLLCVLGLGLCIAYTGRRLGGTLCGFFAGVSLYLVRPFAEQYDWLRLDYLHALLIWLGVALFVRGVTENPERRGCWIELSGVPIGLALLVKPLFALGAFAVLLAWLGLAAFGGRSRDPRGDWPPRVRSVLGSTVRAVAIAALIALPWHLWMALSHSDAFFHVYLGEQILDRATHTVDGAERWTWYFATIAEWWPEVLVMIGVGIASILSGRLGPQQRAAGLGVIWTVAWLIALSCFLDKRTHYLVHIYPGLALATGAVAARCVPLHLQRLGTKTGCLASAVAVTISIAMSPGWALQLPKGERCRPRALWEPVEAVLRTLPPERVYNGSLAYYDAGRMYVKTGRWPRSADWRGNPHEHIPGGAIAVYNLLIRAPDVRDQVLLESWPIVVVRMSER